MWFVSVRDYANTNFQLLRYLCTVCHNLYFQKTPSNFMLKSVALAIISSQLLHSEAHAIRRATQSCVFYCEEPSIFPNLGLMRQPSYFVLRVLFQNIKSICVECRHQFYNMTICSHPSHIIIQLFLAQIRIHNITQWTTILTNQIARSICFFKWNNIKCSYFAVINSAHPILGWEVWFSQSAFLNIWQKYSRHRIIIS